MRRYLKPWMVQVNLRRVSRLLAAIVTAVGSSALSSHARPDAFATSTPYRSNGIYISVQRLLLLLPQLVDAPPSSPSVMLELVVRSAIDRSSRAKAVP